MSKYANEFDGTCPLTAKRFFRFNGRDFAPGDIFDWKKMAVSHRRARQMFEAGKLTVDDKTPAPVAPAKEEDPLESLDYWDADYNLEEIDDMKELRRIADEIGAPYKVSKADQRKAIQDHRKENH